MFSPWTPLLAALPGSEKRLGPTRVGQHGQRSSGFSSSDGLACHLAGGAFVLCRNILQKEGPMIKHASLMVVAAVVGLTSSISTSAIARSTLGIADNDSVYVDGNAFKVVPGKAKGSAAALIRQLDAHDLGPGAIIFRSGGRLYIADAPPIEGARLGSDRYGSDRYGSDRYGSDRYGSDRYGSDRYGSDRYGSDRYGSDRYGRARYSSARYGSDRYGSARYRSDRYGSDRYASDRYGSDRYGSDRYGSDRYGS